MGTNAIAGTPFTIIIIIIRNNHQRTQRQRKQPDSRNNNNNPSSEEEEAIEGAASPNCRILSTRPRLIFRSINGKVTTAVVAAAAAATVCPIPTTTVCISRWPLLVEALAVMST